MVSYKKLLERIVLVLIIFLGLLFRLYYINFGLPHSFYADEPEISELAIKYTYEFKDIVKNNNYYKLIPINYVYGTFPTYFLTVLTMLYSKLNNVAGINFDKTSIFIFLRIVNALINLVIIPIVFVLYFKMFRNKTGALVATMLTALNWKLIVSAHYVNQDTFLTSLSLLAILFLYLFFEKQGNDKVFTIGAGILFGLSVGTKITGIVALPLFIYIFCSKKSFINAIMFVLIALSAFIISNPFSLIFSKDFTYRIFEMIGKEGGIVFDSVDTSPFKYLTGLSFMVSPLILGLSLYGIVAALKNSQNKTFHLFLGAYIVIYLLFFSVQSRRVDRWLLPTLPILLMYASYGGMKLCTLLGAKNKTIGYAFVIILGIMYLHFPMLLLTQFQRQTPKSASYIWLKESVEPLSTKLVYTEEGLDPINKLEGALVIKHQVYESENAQLFFPMDPQLFNYIVISSRVMENYKKEEIKNKFPTYFEEWKHFEETLQDEEKFYLVKDFTLTKPNLIPLSDVFVYKNLQLVTTYR